MEGKWVEKADSCWKCSSESESLRRAMRGLLLIDTEEVGVFGM